MASTIVACKPVPKCFNPVLWLTGDNPNGNQVTPANNSSLSQWTDCSGLGNHATQSTGGSQPIFKTNQQNGLSTINFNGSSQFMNFSNIGGYFSNSMTCFIVSNAATTALSSGIFMVNVASSSNRISIAYPWNDGNYYFDFGNISGGGRLSGADGQSTGSYFINSFLVTPGTGMKIYSGNTVIYSNGTTSTVSALSSGTLCNSSTNYWSGSIGEIILYNTALSSSQITAIYNYLHKKWNV